MSNIKIVALFACSFLIGLFFLVSTLENPEIKQYDEVVEMLMTQKSMSSVQEVLDAFPELNAIKSKIDRIASLKSSVNRMTAGPSPNMSSEESVQLRHYTQEIKTLQNQVQSELAQLQTLHSSFAFGQTIE